jgi:hypothetical protein
MRENPIICYKFASRSRPKRFFEALDNIFALARYPHFFILATLDSDDPKMNTDEVLKKIVTYKNVIPQYGQSRNKIHAINRDMDKAGPWDILITMSDDMKFIAEGFDAHIVSSMQKYFPDGDGCLCYWDGGKETSNKFMTMSIMGRKFYERFGYIYQPDYISLRADDEATAVAIILDKFQPMEIQIASHEHPANGFPVADPQYVHTESFWAQDTAMCEQRKKRNFDVHLATSPQLSILICTIPSRKEMFSALITRLNHQVESLNPLSQSLFLDSVQILFDDREGITVGAKRDALLRGAIGKFIVFIDDDDWISDNYVKLITDIIIQNPGIDCIGINGWITTNGMDRREWKISKDYGWPWYEKDNVYYRSPNHISPVRREIALQAGFPDKSFCEDADYSERIFPFLKKEAKIAELLYHYRFATK